MRGLAVSHRRFVTAATRASVRSRRPGGGIPVRRRDDMGRQHVARHAGDGREPRIGEQNHRRALLRRRFAKRRDILLVAADVEGDDHVLAADLDHPVAPQGGLALDEIHVAAHDAEMALGIARERAREAPAREMDVPARIGKSATTASNSAGAMFSTVALKIPDHRFGEGGERGRALALVGGAGLGERREQLRLQFLAQVLLEIRKAAEARAA